MVKPRKIITAGAALAAAVGLTLATAAPAEAREKTNLEVGRIFGEYTVSTVDYTGDFSVAEGTCIRIQRKAAGVWRDNVDVILPVSAHGIACEWVYGSDWKVRWFIRDNTLALNTTAIQIITDDGVQPPRRLVLCVDTADCRKM